MVSNSRYAAFQSYPALVHTLLPVVASYTQNATSSYVAHPSQLHKVHKGVCKVAVGIDMSVYSRVVESYLQCLPASNFENRQQVGNLVTHHMRSIRGKILKELNPWHGSKFTKHSMSL